MDTTEPSAASGAIFRRRFMRTAALAAAAGAHVLHGWPGLAAGRKTEGRQSDRRGREAVSQPLRLWYVQPAANWNEALPLGNGRVGAMVFGSPARERLQLNEETIWTGKPDSEKEYQCDGPKALPEIRWLVYKGQWSEAQDLFGEAMVKNKWWSKYRPLGDLWIEVPGHDAATGYCRDLSLDTAVATVRYRVGDVTFLREMFISQVDQVLVIRLSASRPGAVSFVAHLAGVMDYAKTHGGGGEVVTEDGAEGKVIGKIRTEASGLGETVLHGKVDGDMIAYQARLRVIPQGSTLRTEGDRVRVEGADAAVLLLAAATNFRNFRDVSGNPETATVAHLAKAAAKDYTALRADHVREHGRLFNRVSLGLPASPSSGLPTDQRLAAMSQGQDDPLLAALQFQYGRYLLISSSRPGTRPPNLQGIWCGDRNPAWDSKYTTNINLEMNYYPVDIANLGECLEPLVRFCDDLRVTGGWAAKHAFGVRGWFLGFNTDLWRGVWPVGGKLAFWSTWPTGGAWLCNALWDHYRFTGDREYLERIYPVLKGSAEYFLDTLQEHPTLKYLMTCPSSSPENRHHKIAGKEWALQPSICAGPTMDM